MHTSHCSPKVQEIKNKIAMFDIISIIKENDEERYFLKIVPFPNHRQWNKELSSLCDIYPFFFKRKDFQLKIHLEKIRSQRGFFYLLLKIHPVCLGGLRMPSAQLL